MKLKDIKPKVRHILANHPEARNNDGTLLAYFIVEYFKHMVIKDLDNEPAIKLRNLKHLPPIESIRRSRQIIQNVDKEFPPTDPKVIKGRRIKEINWREAEVREASMV